MDSTVNTLCNLIDVTAEVTGRSPTTVSRIVTGSGDTIRRLRAVDENGRPKHRISTDRAARAMQRLSEIWPDGTPWPAEISRPRRRRNQRAA